MHIVNQFGGARVRQHLPLSQMDAQRLHVRTILHSFVHAGWKTAHMRLSAAARHRQSAMFNDTKRSRRHIDNLPALGYAGILKRQGTVAAHASSRQRMVDGLDRQCPFERRPLMSCLAARRLAGGLAQRVRLPSDDGGLLEFSLVMPNFAPNVSTRAHSASIGSNSFMISLSLSASNRVERSRRGSFCTSLR